MSPHSMFLKLPRLLAPFVALVLLLCISSAFAAPPRVLVLNDPSGPPYTNPERTGFLDIVATEAFRRAGFELKLVKLPAERALLLANSGELDGDLSRVAGLERQYPQLIRVPEKLYDLEFSAFSKDPAITADIASLRGRSVGLLRGWKIYESFMAGSANVVAAETVDQAFRLLQGGQIEVFLYPKYHGLAYARMHAIHDVNLLKPPIARREMFLYLSAQHAKQVPKIADALRALTQEGFVKRAFDEALVPFSGTGLR